MAPATPTNKRTALAWARRNLARQIRDLVAAAPTENARGRQVYCRHERDVRNVARGYLSDDFLQGFPECEVEGNWEATAERMLAYATKYFDLFEYGDHDFLSFYECKTCTIH